MASCTIGKRGLKPAKSGMGGRPPREPSSASSRRQTASAASAATPIWRMAVSRGTSRPTRSSVTITPIDPRNHSAVISQSIPEGGGVMSSVTWISTEVLACTRGTQIDHQHGGDADPHGVGGTTPGGPASMGPEKERADPLAPGGVPHVVRDGRQLGVGACR